MSTNNSNVGLQNFTTTFKLHNKENFIYSLKEFLCNSCTLFQMVKFVSQKYNHKTILLAKCNLQNIQSF